MFVGVKQNDIIEISKNLLDLFPSFKSLLKCYFSGKYSLPQQVSSSALLAPLIYNTCILWFYVYLHEYLMDSVIH